MTCKFLPCHATTNVLEACIVFMVWSNQSQHAVKQYHIRNKTKQHTHYPVTSCYQLSFQISKDPRIQRTSSSSWETIPSMLPNHFADIIIDNPSSNHQTESCIVSVNLIVKWLMQNALQESAYNKQYYSFSISTVLVSCHSILKHNKLLTLDNINYGDNYVKNHYRSPY